MVIIVDTTGITVKRTIDDANHIRIGVTNITFWIDGKARSIKEIVTPYNEFSINDFNDLLKTLRYYELHNAACLINRILGE